MSAGYVLITGGAGFVGTNLADELLRRGTPVLVLDNLSRAGVEDNLGWLQSEHGNLLRFAIADVRDADAVDRAVSGATAVFHLAAQAATTRSFAAPLEDLSVNVQGTLNVLEAIRALETPPPLVYASTHLVYGALDDLSLVETESRYEAADLALRAHGIGESRPLEPLGPQGCSKGAADHYVLDYARTHGLSAIVLRLSSIYGPHEFATPEEGWVAHFLARAIQGQPITLFGNGKQVRDVLYVSDLVEALIRTLESARELRGRAFNVGGGPTRTTSLLELVDRIAELQGERPQLRLEPPRPADQRYYVSDVSQLQACTGWAPTIGIPEGLSFLEEWLLATGGPLARRKAA